MDYHLMSKENCSWKRKDMITRKEFVRRCAVACTAGLCSSLGRSQEQAGRQSSCDAEELKRTASRADAARDRFARLIDEIESSMPEQERKQLLHNLGGRCADSYRASLLDRYKGNVRGFLEEGLRTWMAEANYDEAKGTIRIVDKSPTCSCPLVKEGATPPSFCDCTLGWQEEAYSTILGRPVKAELEESILRGGKRCVYRISIV
jgi:predicted ArsR family transcriptional regulator